MSRPLVVGDRVTARSRSGISLQTAGPTWATDTARAFAERTSDEVYAPFGEVGEVVALDERCYGGSRVLFLKFAVGVAVAYGGDSRQYGRVG